MKNSFGTNVILTLFGESHGDCIGAVLDGIQPGLKVNEEHIAERLKKRRGIDILSTARREKDDFKIVSGVKNGFTEGTPICLLIPNEDVEHNIRCVNNDCLRPSHADYTAECKYHGYQDKCGGGHFSGRITAPIVALGSILTDALKSVNINIFTHIKQLGDVKDREFSDLTKDAEYLENMDFSVLDSDAEQKMRELIIKTKNDGDSVGGMLETSVTGMPCGIGEPWFDTVEGMISHAVFSIPAVKGIEFGKGFKFAELYGSNANDEYYMKDGKVCIASNNNGGVTGGITNGMPIVFRTSVKPTPSISKVQNTVDIKKSENTRIAFSGRNDPTIVHRAAPVINCITAFVICDMLSQTYGNDFIDKLREK